ncbi:AI-2E family transporter [Porphyromonas levii]|uniref:AI-2E family transporter n=1 Tax=Porphyromonas levii TaxID=28114 RepID=UPI001B8B1055|nr:AI-2E family transporter [Porphyromonas levii]MBR8758679.1 putative transport protein [Porphyromonas levii]
MKPRKIEEFFQQPFTFDRVARIIFVLLLVGALLFATAYLANFLAPFVLAWLLAYLMLPVVKWFQTKLKVKPRWLAVTLVLLLTLGVLIGVLAILIPSITKEINRGWVMLQEYNIGAYLIGLLPEGVRSKSELLAKLEALAYSVNIQELVTSIEGIFSRGWGLLQGTFTAISGAMVIFIFLFYFVFMLIDYDKVRQGFIDMLPESARPVMQETGDIIGYFVNTYFRGQALISLICGVILAIGFAIIGLPMGITLGLFIGLLNMIPYLQILGYIPLVLLVGLQAVATGENFFLLLLFASIVVIISEVIQSFILTPTIQGQSLGIHPIAIMLSLTVWGAIFGFLGMLFALPLTMIFYTLYMKYIVGSPTDLDTHLREEMARRNRQRLLRRRR